MPPLKLLSFFLTYLLLFGCASQRLANQDQFDHLALEQAKQFSGDSKTALTHAEEAHQKALINELTFYAPLHMEQAQESLNKARDLQTAGNKAASLSASAKVLALLQGAQANKKKVVVLLTALLDQKSVLDQIGSPKVLAKRYTAHVDAISELIQLIESGKDQEALADSKDVLEQLTQLERSTLLTLHWQPAQDMLDKAEDEEADNNAKKSYAKAEFSVEQAKRTISQDYKDRSLVEATGKEALHAAAHALYVNRAAQKLFMLNHEDAENAVLDFENLLAHISDSFALEDLRHMSLKDQAYSLAKNLKNSLKNNLQDST